MGGMKKLIPLLIALAIVVVACDGDGSNLPSSLPSLTLTTVDGAATTTVGETSTTEPGRDTTTTMDEATTTLAPATTTTNAPQRTTTTGAATTTTEAEDASQALDMSDAIAQAAPEGWTVTQSDTLDGSTESLAGLLVSACTAGRLEGSALDDISVAAYSTQVQAPPNVFDPLLPPEAFFETRVFESEDAAARAFAAVEIVTRRADGRACLASRYLSWIVELLPIDASVQLRTDDVTIPGANFGVRLVWTVTVRERSVDLYLDVVAHRSGDYTIVGAFASAEEPFPPLVAVSLLRAGTGT